MTRITTPFDRYSTAAEVCADVDLSAKRAVVTGAASGIGLETARVLAGCGARVTLAVRDTDAGARAAREIVSAQGAARVDVASLDLTDDASIAAFVRAWSGPLDVLVNNAGVMAVQELRRTARGNELQFATNHLGHFALTVGLHRALAESGARVVCVSSAGHMLSPVVFDDVDFRFRAYDPLLAYGQSKTANVLFAVEASRRWRDDGITANALNPGAIRTNLQRHVGGRLLTPEPLQKSVAQGAATSVLLAASPLLEGVAGRYFNDCNEAVPVDHRPADFAELVNGVAPYALDAANAARLWDLSVRLTA